MKIALVRARYNPYGGAERFAARALTALARVRDGTAELSVLARRWNDVEATASHDGRAAVRLVRCDPFYVGSVWRDASFARAVRRHLRTAAYDLVQSHERIVGLPVYRAGDGVHAAWLDRRAQAGGAATRLAIAVNPHHRYLLAVERAMFEHPSLRVVICNSQMVRREILDRFDIAAGNLVLIRNGVDVDRFHPDAVAVHRDATRRRLAIGDGATVFAMVGSGFERKGVAAALGAVALCPDAVLVVVGDDKHRARYEADAARLGVDRRVRFVGAVADPLPFYAAADFLLAPTLYDPFPNAVLEAMACGLPAIATDACGAAEIIVDDTGGWVVPVADRAALVDAMTTAMACDEPRRDAMRRAARAAAEPLSLTALSTALTDLYDGLLQRR